MARNSQTSRPMTDKVTEGKRKRKKERKIEKERKRER
jgi:hypothetical protein